MELSNTKLPVLGDDAKIGLAGKMLKLFEDKVEPSESALLFSFLTIMGNIIGDEVYIEAGGGKHSGRLFTVMVGQTAKSRKGTSWSYIQQLFWEIDCDYVKNNIARGLSTGEGLIHAVRDATYKKEKDKKTGKEEVVYADEGVKDKRKLIIETEFARVLRAKSREKNILSEVIRQCWDSGNLGVMTRSDPYKATGAHISIIGHITQPELEGVLTLEDNVNGFANRFIWVHVERVLLVPLDFNLKNQDRENFKFNLSEKLSAIKPGKISFTPEAEKQWVEIYKQMANEKPGLIGFLLARSEPMILRLAIIYCCLDGKSQIETSHLRAAMACYQYLEKSAYLIFKDSTGNVDADSLLEELKTREYMTATEVSNFFGRNKKQGELNKIAETLMGQKRIIMETTQGTFGAPTTKFKINPDFTWGTN